MPSALLARVERNGLRGSGRGRACPPASLFPRVLCGRERFARSHHGTRVIFVRRGSGALFYVREVAKSGKPLEMAGCALEMRGRGAIGRERYSSSCSVRPLWELAATDCAGVAWGAGDEQAGGTLALRYVLLE